MKSPFREYDECGTESVIGILHLGRKISRIMCHADENIPLKIGNGVTIGHRSIIHGCTIEDVAMWEREGRFDILEWVHPITLGEGHYIYDIWISPKTGDDVWRCVHG